MLLQYKCRQNKSRFLNNLCATRCVSFCLILPQDIRPERCNPLVAWKDKKKDALTASSEKRARSLFNFIHWLYQIHRHQKSPTSFAANCKQKLIQWGTRWRSWLRHCATSRKVAGSIPDGVTGIFHWHNPSGCTVALGLTQPLTEMSTRNISWGVKAAGA